MSIHSLQQSGPSPSGSQGPQSTRSLPPPTTVASAETGHSTMPDRDRRAEYPVSEVVQSRAMRAWDHDPPNRRSRGRRRPSGPDLRGRGQRLPEDAVPLIESPRLGPAPHFAVTRRSPSPEEGNDSAVVTACEAGNLMITADECRSCRRPHRSHPCEGSCRLRRADHRTSRLLRPRSNCSLERSRGIRPEVRLRVAAQTKSTWPMNLGRGRTSRTGQESESGLPICARESQLTPDSWLHFEPGVPASQIPPCSVDGQPGEYDHARTGHVGRAAYI